MHQFGRAAPRRWLATAVLVMHAALCGAHRSVLAFALLPDPKSGDVVHDLESAARWSPEPDPFGDGSGFHDGLQVAVAPDFGARLALSTPDDEQRLRAVIRAAFAAWETPELRFDIDFERLPVEGVLPSDNSGFEIDLFAVPGSHPAFMGTTYFGLTETSQDVAAGRLLSNGQRVDGRVILRADIFINVDSVLQLGGLIPPERQPDALQRLLMHEIGHALGLGHPNTYDTFNNNFDTDLDPFDVMRIDPHTPFATMMYSPNRNAQAIMSNDRSHVGRFLFFTELQNDNRGGRDVLYPSLRRCPADCDGDGSIDVAELLTAVTIALGDAPVSTCLNADVDGDGSVAVDELIVGIDNALSGCEGKLVAAGTERRRIDRPADDRVPDVVSVRCALDAAGL